MNNAELQTLRDLLLLFGALIFTLTMWLLAAYGELKEEKKKYSKMFLSAEEKHNAKIMKAIENSVNQDLQLKR